MRTQRGVTRRRSVLLGLLAVCALPGGLGATRAGHAQPAPPPSPASADMRVATLPGGRVAGLATRGHYVVWLVVHTQTPPVPVPGPPPPGVPPTYERPG